MKRKVLRLGISLFLFISTAFTYTHAMSNTKFAEPLVGSFYPIYNSGVGQWNVPHDAMPFDKINTLFIAFAHVHEVNGKIILDYENARNNKVVLDGDSDHDRIMQIVHIAKAKNPKIKLLISLGWGQDDWHRISADIKKGKAMSFPQSIIDFIRINQLDGFDIDYEGVYGISDNDFTKVIQKIRNEFKIASNVDGKPYILSITPDNSYHPLTSESAQLFDLVNLQTYWNRLTVANHKVYSSLLEDFIQFGVPANKISVGLVCDPPIDDIDARVAAYQIKHLNGVFFWVFTKDAENEFQTTNNIYAKMHHQ